MRTQRSWPTNEHPEATFNGRVTERGHYSEAPQEALDGARAVSSLAAPRHDSDAFRQHDRSAANCTRQTGEPFSVFPQPVTT
jgi:hypothetical protein